MLLIIPTICFSNFIFFTPPWTSGAFSGVPNSLLQKISVGDGQAISLRDVANKNNVSARVSFDVPEIVYNLSFNPTISVIDPEANLEPNTINIVKAKVTSSSDLRGIPVNLKETGPDTGIFKGTFSFTSGSSFSSEPSTPMLHANSGDKIRVTYNGAHLRMKEILNGVTHPGTAVVTDYTFPATTQGLIFIPVGAAANVTFLNVQINPKAVGTVTLSYANAHLGSQPPTGLQVYQCTPVQNGASPAFNCIALDGVTVNTRNETVAARTTTFFVACGSKDEQRCLTPTTSGIFSLGVGGFAFGDRSSIALSALSESVIKQAKVAPIQGISSR